MNAFNADDRQRKSEVATAITPAPCASVASQEVAGVMHATRFIAGYVVVSEWRGKNGNVTDTSYERCATVNDAADLYTEYQDGEHVRATAVGIFPCDERGLPIGGRLDPVRLMALVAETRAS